MFYSSSLESEMKKLYNYFSEKDKRRYAAIEAQKLEWGGISYIMQLFGSSLNTIVQGIEYLEKMDETTIDNLKIKKKEEAEKVFYLLRAALMKPFYKSENFRQRETQ